jgi:hypothetical protein
MVEPRGIMLAEEIGVEQNPKYYGGVSLRLTARQAGGALSPLANKEGSLRDEAIADSERLFALNYQAGGAGNIWMQC